MKKTKLLCALISVVTVLFAFSVTAFAAEECTYGDFKYIVLEGDTVEITAYTGNDTFISIPDKIEGKAVTEIGDEVFWGMSDIESITIPETVTSIGKLAFASCGRLSTLELPVGLVSIGDNAFDMCGLNTLVIPETVTSIGKNAFFYTRMTAITVDEDNEHYSSDEYGVLFNKDKTELIKYPCGNQRTEYAIPDTVTSIYEAAFIWGSYLKTVTIPEGVTAIMYETFSECEALETVVIPDSVETIYANAFSYVNIKTITIGSALKEIEHNAFTADFDDVYYNGTRRDWNSIEIAYSNRGFNTANIHFKECSPHSFTHYYSNNDATYANDGTKTAYCDNLCGEKDIITDEGTRLTLATTSKLTFTSTANSVTLKWSAVEGAGGYRVFVKDTVTGKWNTAVRTTGKKTTATIKNLESGTKYTFAVRAYLNNGSIVWAPKYKRINTVTKPGVTDKVTSTSTEDSVTLKWNKVPGATGYRIYVVRNGKWKALKTTTGLTYTATGLTAGTKYTFAVKAYTKLSGTSYWASKYAKLGTATVPGTTKNVTASKISSEYVTLKWDSVRGATGYRVYVWNTQTKNWDIVYKATTKLTVTLKNLVPGKNYIFAVKAYTKTDSGYIWAKDRTQLKIKTGPLTDDYVRRMFITANDLEEKWHIFNYVFEDEINRNTDLRYRHILDPKDYITVYQYDYEFKFYAVIDDEIKSTADLRKEMLKYFTEEHTEDFIESSGYGYRDYNGKMYMYNGDGGGLFQPEAPYKDSLKRISSTEYLYRLYSKKDNDYIDYKVVYENGKWVFGDDYGQFFPIWYPEKNIYD